MEKIDWIKFYLRQIEKTAGELDRKKIFNEAARLYSNIYRLRKLLGIKNENNK